MSAGSLRVLGLRRSVARVLAVPFALVAVGAAQTAAAAPVEVTEGVTLLGAGAWRHLRR